MSPHRANFSNKSVIVDEKQLYGSIGELENAIIALFWVGNKPKLGSLSVTLPDKSSSQLLEIGMRCCPR